MRRTLALFVVLAVGCGTGTSSPRATRSLPPPFDITRAKAGVLIKAGTLTAADMPGYKFARSRPSHRDELLGGDLVLCLGGDVGRQAAIGPSVEYSKGPFELFGENVNVAATAAEATADLALFARAQRGGCLEKVFIGEFAQEGVVARHVATRGLAMAVRGATRTVAFVFSATGIKDEVSLKVREIVAFAQVGHAEVTVYAITFRQAAPPTATVKALLARAVSRIKAKA